MRWWPRLIVGAALVALTTGCLADASEPPPDRPAAVACATGSITARGSSAQANAVNLWIRNYQVSCPDAAVEYDSVGSGAGVRAFIAGAGDFAGSDAPLTAEDRPKADARCRTGPAIHLPMVVGTVALAYNVAGVGDLQLKPATIARIFAGAATRWNDPAIAADNPGVILPSTRILAVHRADNSGTTDSFTRFLAASAGRDWAFGTGTAWRAPGGGAARGNGGVAAALTSVDGAVGYLERSYAQAYNLNTAKVLNGAGRFVAASDAAAATTVAGAKTATSGDDLVLEIDVAGKAAGAYPIVSVTYEVVCAKGTPAPSLALVKSFLAYTSSPAGQSALTRLGYTPLPEQIRTRVADAVSRLG